MLYMHSGTCFFYSKIFKFSFGSWFSSYMFISSCGSPFSSFLVQVINRNPRIHFFLGVTFFGKKLVVSCAQWSRSRVEKNSINQKFGNASIKLFSHVSRFPPRCWALHVHSGLEEEYIKYVSIFCVGSENPSGNRSISVFLECPVFCKEAGPPMCAVFQEHSRKTIF